MRPLQRHLSTASSPSNRSISFIYNRPTISLYIYLSPSSTPLSAIATVCADNNKRIVMDKENVKKSVEMLESRKSHSWWWEGHIKSAKWLFENMEEMDNNIDRMVKLIEDDGDSLTKKAEMYYKKRPELVSIVQEFQRMYQALAERYAQLTGDLRKNVPDLHSLGSNVPDIGSEPTTLWYSPNMKLPRLRSTHRAAGFDVFLGSGGSTSDRYSRLDELASFSDSEESDISSVHSYPRFPVSGDDTLHEKMIQMDTELSVARENANGSLKRSESLSVIELQLKLASYEEENANLKMELQNVRSLNSNNNLETDDPDIYEKQALELDECNSSTETEVSDPDQKTQALVSELSTTKGRLLEVEKQVVRLSTENNLAHENIRHIQDQFKAAQKEAVVFKAKLDSEMRKSSKWHDRIARYKASLIDRDVEIRELKDLVSDADKKYQLHAEISRLSDEKGRVEEKFRELEVRCHTLDTQHAVAEKKLNDEIEQLKADISEKQDQLEALKSKCDSLVSERDELSTQAAKLATEARLINGLKLKVEELNEEVERQKVLISEGAEQKREAIRQLCFSLEHYRDGYEYLREAVIGHKRLVVGAP